LWKHKTRRSCGKQVAVVAAYKSVDMDNIITQDVVAVVIADIFFFIFLDRNYVIEG